MFRIPSLAALLFACQALVPVMVPAVVPVMAGDLADHWTLTRIDGFPVTFTATLDLSQPGKLTGQAPCNSYGGTLSAEGQKFIPGPILSTKMACDELADENLYLQALQMTESAVVAGDLLTLTGEQVLVFTRKLD